MSYSNAVSAQKASEFREAMPQILAVSIKNFFVLGVGMTLGFPTILIADLLYWEDKIKVTQEDISWIGSINFLFVPVGCLISGPLFRKLGAKTSMQLANVPLVMVLFLIKFSYSLWHIYLALSIFGLVLGCINAPATFYVSDVSTPKLRSLLSSLTPLSFALGQLLTVILSLFFTWRDVALITALLPLLSINLLLLLPESPEWLILNGRETNARQALSRLRGFVPLEAIEEEFKEIEKGMEFEVFGWGIVGERRFYGPVLLGGLLGFVSCFGVGIGSFAVEVLRGVNSPVDKYHGMLLFAGFEVLSVVFYVLVVRCLGKRKLAFVSITSCGCCLLLTAVFSHLNLTKAEINFFNLNPAWIPTLALLVFTFSGIKALPYIYFTEIHAKALRTSSTNLTISLNYLTYFSCNKLFPSLIANLTLPGTLLVFSCLTLASLIPVYYLVVETQWMSPKEQQELYEDKTSPEPQSLTGQRNSLEDSLPFNFLLANGPNTYKGFSVIDSSVI